MFSKACVANGSPLRANGFPVTISVIKRGNYATGYINPSSSST